MPVDAQVDLICPWIIKIECDRMIGVNVGSLLQLRRFPAAGILLRLRAEGQADSQQKDAKPAGMEG
jgi:hypothetical protein